MMGKQYFILSSRSERYPRGHALVPILLTLGFLALAAWFVAGPDLLDDHVWRTAKTVPQPVSIKPPRTALVDPPTTIIAGSPKQCVDCHRFFKPQANRTQPLSQHQEIIVDHGLNTRCLNCHAPDDRNKLRSLDGSLITYNQSEKLCASCHGTTYRDWQNGIHGKIFGSWMAGAENRGNLTCTQCHDPHRPAFGQMNAQPGPNTLRMAGHAKDSAIHTRAIDQRNPLRRWHYPTDESTDHTSTEQY